MIKLRLTRIGKTHQPFYRVVAVPQRSKRDGKSIEQLGHYNPYTKEIKIDKERALHWISVGAQPSDTVKRLLIKQGILKEEKGEKKKFLKEAGEKSKSRKAAKEEKANVAKAEKEAPKVEEVKEEVVEEAKVEETTQAPEKIEETAETNS